MLKNFIYIVVGLVYFTLFFAFKTTQYYDYLINISDYISYIISIINGLFALALSFYTINLLIDKLKFYINKYTSKTNTKYDGIIGNLIIKFVEISKYIISVYIALNIVAIPEKISLMIDKVFNVSFIVTFLFLLTTFVNTIFDELKKKEDNSSISKQVFPILNKVAVVFIWIVGTITVIGNLGYNISALLTGAGVGGLAIALAAQKTVANIFGAISVIVNRPFAIGDFVKVGGFVGTVRDIGLTYLKLGDLNGHEILIPNENIISSSIENFTKRNSRMTSIDIGITYNTPLEKTKKAVEIIENILDNLTGEEESKTINSNRVHFDNFGDFSLNIKATYFSKILDFKEFLKQKEEINLEIKKQFEKEGIDIAFPTQTLYIEKENK